MSPLQWFSHVRPSFWFAGRMDWTSGGFTPTTEVDLCGPRRIPSPDRLTAVWDHTGATACTTGGWSGPRRRLAAAEWMVELQGGRVRLGGQAITVLREELVH